MPEEQHDHDSVDGHEIVGPPLPTTVDVPIIGHGVGPDTDDDPVSDEDE